MIRVAGLHALADEDVAVQSVEGMTPQEQLIEVNKKLTPNAALSQSVSYNPTDYDEAMGLLLKDDLILGVAI